MLWTHHHCWKFGVSTCFCFEDTCAEGPYMLLVDKLAFNKYMYTVSTGKFANIIALGASSS